MIVAGEPIYDKDDMLFVIGKILGIDAELFCRKAMYDREKEDKETIDALQEEMDSLMEDIHRLESAIQEAVDTLEDVLAGKQIRRKNLEIILKNLKNSY